jgi:hypothetical protein
MSKEPVKSVIKAVAEPIIIPPALLKMQQTGNALTKLLVKGNI